LQKKEDDQMATLKGRKEKQKKVNAQVSLDECGALRRNAARTCGI
jgi:hypothetical protein